jgi:hypothetical protein
MNETRVVKDLAIGDVIQVEGFDTNLTVRSARKIKKGLDAGKLQVTLTTPDGENEVMGFNPDEPVKVVGKNAQAVGKAKGESKDQGAGKGQGTGKAKGKTKAKAKPEAEAAAATPAPETQTTKAPATEGKLEPKAKTRKKAGRANKAEGENKLSAIDAAAQVLAESGQAMNCQELIQVLAEKGLWTSPGGKTPAATLYSSILRELQAKGDQARFRKTDRGKFAAANSKRS